jgi:hypothetical protein
MVTALLVSFAAQIIRERLIRYGSLGYGHDATMSALIAAGGDRVLPLLQGVEGDLKGGSLGISFAECIAYGVSPAHMRSIGLPAKNPYKTDDDNGLSDPLHLTAFFSMFGLAKEAAAMMAERQLYLDCHDKWQANKNRTKIVSDEVLGRVEWGDYVVPRAMVRTWVLPDFEDLHLDRVKMHDILDSFYCEGAFEETSYLERLKRSLDSMNIEAFAMISGLKNRRLHGAMRQASYHQAHGLCTNDKKGGFRYGDMATFVRLCEPGDAVKLFNELVGARQMVALFRHDTPEIHFVRGLRQLASASPDVRKEILERIGRAPTLDEVRSVRSIGIINILDEIDWELMKDIAGAPGLRATALPFAEKLGPVVLRRFLTDHPARVKRKPNIETEPAVAGRSLMVAGSSSIADWAAVMTRLHAMWETSRSLRTRLLAITGNELISFLALLKPHGASSPDIENALQQHPRWKDIQEALAGYTPPKLTTLWS